MSMSQTLAAQHDLEASCLPLLGAPAPSLSSLQTKHSMFLKIVLGLDRPLPAGFLALDASHPWIVFWSVNALKLLKTPLSSSDLERVADTILACQSDEGGFGGGPGQPGHLAATYAAIMALTYVPRHHWARIRTDAMHDWLLSLKNDDGSIRVCAGGEADPRATYCALSVATILGIASPELRAGIGQYLSRCQTYEGGFANMPWGEAHGGYAFCSVASLFLIYPEDPKRGLIEFCDIASLKRWLVARQDLLVPGFSGRTNKLVDGCYSHWVGGCWPLLSQAETADSEVWSRKGLRDYILHCCQSPNGGLRDKPGTRPDGYHTNYCLCGLACAEHRYAMAGSVFEWDAEIVSDKGEALIEPINPVFGVPIGFAESMHEYFALKKQAYGQLPSSKEYQGFALYLSATAVLIVYALWAFLPSQYLQAIRVEYYPSRWWAIALPAFVLMLMLYTYIALSAYNTERLTYKPTKFETVADQYSTVYDVPITTVNEQLYGKKSDSQK